MRQWFYIWQGQQQGPIPEESIVEMFRSGQLPVDTLVWTEGLDKWTVARDIENLVPVALSPPPIPATSPPPPANCYAKQTSPMFLYISPARLVILSIVSMSLYEAYWIYKNWRYVKERDSLKIRPFWRGVFGIFFCHNLLRRIHEDGEARAIETPRFSPGGLATGWVILLIIGNIVSRAPGIGASIISAFIPSFLCLVPVQNYINSVTQKRTPGQPYYGWSSGHIVCLVIGIIVWALLLIGLGAEV